MIFFVKLSKDQVESIYLSQLSKQTNDDYVGDFVLNSGHFKFDI